MRRHAVALAEGAKRDLRAMRDLGIRDRLEQAIAALAADPRPPGVKKLKGTGAQWRIRVGDWRVVYVIEDDRLLVLVVAVAKRDEVYR